MAQYRRDLFCLLEAALIGLFFVQAARFLYGTLYAHVSSADLIIQTRNLQAIAGAPGVIDVTTIPIELLVAGLALFAPFLFVIFSRLWFGPAIAAIIAAAGRVLMTANGGTTFGVIGAAATVGAAGLYFATIAVRRSGMLPVAFICGFAGDQLIRLYGNTFDKTWDSNFLTEQTVLSLGLFLIAAFAAVFERVERNPNEPLQKGEISGWGAFALGGLLYLEFAVLGLPNTLARHAGVEYIAVAPWLIAVTLLPLIPEVRSIARRFLGIFDGQYRGWVWFLLICLLLVIGYRFNGMLSAAILLAAQLFISLTWWWVIQPASTRINFSGPSITFGLLLFLALTGADFFTYQYAYVRDIQEPFAAILRAFHGLGLAVTLFATLLACFPAVLARKRLPWRGGSILLSLAALIVVVMAAVLAGSLAAPTIIKLPADPTQLRIATLNLNNGYSLYYGTDLPAVGSAIQSSGADVVLLQEVETGRLTSYSVDQAAWLGRYLNMQVNYFPTTEALQGLAILSKVPVQAQDAILLSGQSKQTGVQFVRLQPQPQTQPQLILDVYNTELSPVLKTSPLSIDAQVEQQTQQVKEIFAFIDLNHSLSNRLLIGGTFNHLPDANIYKYMEQQNFVDPFKDRPADKSNTLRQVDDVAVRADYLWLHQGALTPLTPMRLGVTDLPQSSHNLAVVEIALSPSN